jgi:outer membrane protein TolC
MKIKLLVAAAATVVASSAMAQSAFQGFFGQVGVGYESASTSFTGGTVSGTGYSVSSNNSNSFAGTVAIGGYFPVSGSFY